MLHKETWLFWVRFLKLIGDRKSSKHIKFNYQQAFYTIQLRVLKLCRRFDALWWPDEAFSQWQAIVDGAEPGSLAQQLQKLRVPGYAQ